MAEEIRISRDFIEKELPSAPPLYVSVYLMTLACGGSSAVIAEKLGALESDVLRAWAYWKDRGFLQKTAAEPAAKPKAESIAELAAKKPLPASSRPDYAPAELAEYMKHQEVRRLFESASKKLGKFLSQQDMSLLFSFHDWLGLPIDVIDLLISYCVSNGHYGMRYIEKVALGWAEEGIDTAEKAAEYIELRKTGFRVVLRAFGQGNRMPVAAEESYIKKWLKEYGLPLELVQTACERTVLQTGKPSFPYADSILRQWRDAGVKTSADIAALDEAFAAKKAGNAQKSSEQKPAGEAPRKKPAPRQNKFINYTQSEWDFAEIERLEREQRRKR